MLFCGKTSPEHFDKSITLSYAKRIGRVYLLATVVAVLAITFLILHKFCMNKILILGTCLYAIGLLPQSWFGLIRTFLNYLLFWIFLKLVKYVISTTRNGIVEGILFISIGMLLSYKIIFLPPVWVAVFISGFLEVLEEKRGNGSYRCKKIVAEGVKILIVRLGKVRIYGVTIFGNTTFGVTIYGIMQYLQTIYCRFGEFCVGKCGTILLLKIPFSILMILITVY